MKEALIQDYKGHNTDDDHSPQMTHGVKDLLVGTQKRQQNPNGSFISKHSQDFFGSDVEANEMEVGMKGQGKPLI